MEAQFEKVAGLVKAYQVATVRYHSAQDQYNGKGACGNVNKVTYAEVQAARAGQAKALTELGKVWESMTEAEQDAYDAWFNEV